MIWAALFIACMPDALRGPECHQVEIVGFQSFAACEINRPFIWRMMRDRFDADGWGAAEIDAGRCEPMPPGLPV